MQELQDGDPVQIGPYRLTGRLGSGGMGRVFLGRSPGGRLVAVKVIREDLAEDADFRARFRREVAGARLVSGFYTAPVVDAELDAPVPWLVTGYVPGPSLAAAVTGHGPLSTPSVVALAAALAEGLRAIHAAGVVHRDLKPSNVLLAADGPRIIDFGVARAAESTGLTHTGLVLGSPGFMSPEQATGAAVGPASDVFSLGAVLAFAAAGSGPFGSGAAAALLYRIVHETPDLDKLPEPVRGIVARCLAKDPGQRPALDRLLAELDGADLDPEWLPAEVVAEFAVALPGQPPEFAGQLPGTASAVTGLLPDPERTVQAREYEPAQRAPRLRPEHAGFPLARMEHETRVTALRFSADATRIATVSGRTVRLWDGTLAETSRLPHAHQVMGADFSPDGTLLATRTEGPVFGSKHPVTLWDTATGDESARLPHRDHVVAAAFSPDGTRLATAGEKDATRLWEPRSGQEIARFGNGGTVSRLAFSPDGSRLVLLSSTRQDCSVRDTATGGEVLRIRHERWIRVIAFSPDSTRLVSFSEDGVTQLWDVVSGREQPWHTGTRVWDEATGRERPWTERMARWAAVFSPDGTRLATAAADGTVWLWDPATGQETARMPHHETISLMAFSPDGSWLATAGANGRIRLWDLPEARERARMRHAGVLAMVALRLDGTRLVTVGGDAAIRVWDPADGQETSRMPRGRIRVFSPDGTCVATSSDRTTHLLDIATGARLAEIGHDDSVESMMFSPDGSLLATRAGKAVHMWAT